MLDLFTPIVPRSRRHHNFTSVCEFYSEGAKRVLLDWSEVFIDRDQKIVAEFQTTFNSAFWELYLFASLREMGFGVNFDFAAPDFVVYRGGVKEFVVEATIASNAQSAKAEWDRPAFRPEDWANIDVSSIAKSATLRLANSLATKYAKYIETYSLLPHVHGVPFVLAVASFDQPFFFFEGLAPVLQVLYGYDILHPDQPHIEVMHKENGSPVNMGIFLTPEYRHVSALLFSTLATASKLRAMGSAAADERIKFVVTRASAQGGTTKETISKDDYTERLLDGIHVFHNPSADFQFTQTTFEHPGVVQWGFDRSGRKPFRVGEPEFPLQRLSLIMKVT